MVCELYLTIDWVYLHCSKESTFLWQLKTDYSCYLLHRLPESFILWFSLLCHPEQPIIPPHDHPKKDKKEKWSVKRIILKHRLVPWSRLANCPHGELGQQSWRRWASGNERRDGWGTSVVFPTQCLLTYPGCTLCSGFFTLTSSDASKSCLLLHTY